METLKKYTCPTYPGWNLAIPDALRLEAFLKEFREYEKAGQWQNFVIVYLPQDHTAGTKPDCPTPRACVADNDLAVGRLVEAISHSRFWPKTAIFVNEDDPQDGWDHVDGHRSICLVVSPYVKRRAVVSQFYNQCSVLHTIERILDLPTTSQLVAQSPLMTACFTEKPDLAPYQARPAGVPIDEPNPRTRRAAGQGPAVGRSQRAVGSQRARPHRRRHHEPHSLACVHGHRRGLSGRVRRAHGKGLKRLGLKLDALERD